MKKQKDKGPTKTNIVEKESVQHIIDNYQNRKTTTTTTTTSTITTTTKGPRQFQDWFPLSWHAK